MRLPYADIYGIRWQHKLSHIRTALKLKKKKIVFNFRKFCEICFRNKVKAYTRGWNIVLNLYQDRIFHFERIYER